MVVINEVAWAGTTASESGQYAEWFELYNAGESAADLAGWGLYEAGTEGDVKVISLSGTIGAGDYYLVERSTASSPDPIVNVEADLMGSFGGSGFKNTGETLKLKDGGGVVVDEIPCSGGWFGGDNATKQTMERVNPLLPSSDPSNWASNDGSPLVGSDAAGNPIQGTPRYPNSVSSG